MQKSITEYGAVGDGVFDCTPAYNAALADSVDILTIPAGSYRFQSAPNPIENGMWLVGESLSKSRLIRDYNGGDFIAALDGMGGGLRNLNVHAANGTSGGYGVHLDAGPDGQPANWWHIENVIVTGSGQTPGTWLWPMFLDGQDRSNGLRDVSLSNVRLFNGENGALYARSVVGLNWIGGGAWPGGGNNGKVVIGGGNGVMSEMLLIQTTIGAELNLTNLKTLIFNGHIGSLNSSSSASKCHMSGICSGSKIFNMIDSYDGLI